jgi:hypothetical protein
MWPNDPLTTMRKAPMLLDAPVKFLAPRRPLMQPQGEILGLRECVAASDATQARLQMTDRALKEGSQQVLWLKKTSRDSQVFGGMSRPSNEYRRTTMQ